MKLLTFFLLFLVVLSKNANAQDYTFKDLEVLQERKNFNEFFLHAKDIRPSARDKAWKSMVQDMSEGFVRNLLERPFISSSDLDEVNKLTDWTTIKENIGFIVLRNKFGLKYFNYCFQHEVEKQLCYRKALEFIKKIPTESQMATDLGLIISNFKKDAEAVNVIGMNLWPFFEQMAKTPISEFYCDKPYFRDEITNLIYSKIDELSNKELKKDIDTLVHVDCWAKLKTYFASVLYSPIDSHRIHSFYILNSKEQINSYDKTRFLIHHLLTYPSPDELLSMAWQELLNLSKDYKLREKLMEDLKIMDPLPGKVFKYANEKRSLVIIKAFIENFPEYIDYYSQTCLKYLEGTKNFPNGNPTVECVDLFKTAKSFKLLPDLTIQRFEAARNFKTISI